MSNQLELRAFFFNAQTDYLPYYKLFTPDLPADAKAIDLLKEIESQNENFSYDTSHPHFRINGYVVIGDEPLSEIAERLGNELQIDPLFEYRSNLCLVLNNSDFMESFSLLAPYATEEDQKYYESLYPLHYASETLQYRKDYIGDAILLLADRMIKSGNPHQEEILKAITEPNEGLFSCEYDNNLFNGEDYTETIESLKALAKKHPVDAPSLWEMIQQRLGLGTEEEKPKNTTREIDNAIIPNIHEKLVAYYPDNYHYDEETVQQMKKLIKATAARHIEYKKERKRCGLLILEDEPELAFQKAGSIMLDAFDSQAEVFVVENQEAFLMLSKNKKKIEKIVGREIDLELTTAASIRKQLHHQTA